MRVGDVIVIFSSGGSGRNEELDTNFSKSPHLEIETMTNDEKRARIKMGQNIVEHVEEGSIERKQVK